MNHGVMVARGRRRIGISRGGVRRAISSCVVGMVIAGTIATPAATPVMAPVATPAATLVGDEQHALFTAILADHVSVGRVDYAALTEDERLERYLDQLRATDPATIEDDDARLAFWINVYNATTLKVIVDEYPVESINDLHFGGLAIGLVLGKTVWDRAIVEVNDATLSLDDVEHEIIRKQWAEPRIHFALVCAAKSCPRLRSEAFEGFALAAQLEDQAIVFLGEPLKNYFVLDKRTAYLSKIFDWYGGDFGDDDKELLLYLARYAPAEVAASIRSEPEAWRIEHTKYFWELNGS
jgi:hypothetical protein